MFVDEPVSNEQLLCTRYCALGIQPRVAPKGDWGRVRSYRGSPRFMKKTILEPGEGHLALGRDLSFLICEIGIVVELP